MKKIRLIAKLSFAIACTLGGYLFLVGNFNDDESNTQQSENLLFEKIKINSFDKKNNKTVILSDNVRQIGNDKIELTNTVANIEHNSSKGEVSAKTIISQGDKCEARTDVTLELSDGIKITTDFADIDIKKKTAKADKKILIDYKDTHISADSYDISFNKIHLSKNVTASQNDAMLTCDSFTGLIGKINDKYKLTEGTLNGKILYKSNLHIVSTDGTVRYKNDKIFFDNYTTITGKNKKKPFQLSGNKITIFLSNNSTIEKARCENNFTLKVNGNNITANYGTYENGIITAEGNVSIKSQHGIANCKKAIYNVNTGRLNMTNTGGVIYRKKN